MHLKFYKKGQTLPLIIACTCILLMIGIAFFLISMVFGGSRELANAIDAGNLNIAKQALVTPSLPLTGPGYNVSSALGPSGKLNLNNVNLVWGNALGVALNAYDMVQEDSMDSSNISSTMDQVYNNASTASNNLATTLQNPDTLQSYFLAVANSNPLRMLGLKSQITLQSNTRDRNHTYGTGNSSYYSTAYLDAGTPSNFPVSSLGSLSSDLSGSAISGGYLEGYTPITLPDPNFKKYPFFFVPLQIGIKPHLVSADVFTANENSSNFNWSNAIPNAFSIAASTSVQNSGGTINYQAFAQAEPPTNSATTPSVFPQGFIRITNDGGMSHSCPANSVAGSAANFPYNVQNLHASEYAAYKIAVERAGGCNPVINPPPTKVSGGGCNQCTSLLANATPTNTPAEGGSPFAQAISNSVPGGTFGAVLGSNWQWQWVDTVRSSAYNAGIFGSNNGNPATATANSIYGIYENQLAPISGIQNLVNYANSLMGVGSAGVASAQQTVNELQYEVSTYVDYDGSGDANLQNQLANAQAALKAAQANPGMPANDPALLTESLVTYLRQNKGINGLSNPPGLGPNSNIAGPVSYWGAVNPTTCSGLAAVMTAALNGQQWAADMIGLSYAYPNYCWGATGTEAGISTRAQMNFYPTGGAANEVSFQGDQLYNMAQGMGNNITVAQVLAFGGPPPPVGNVPIGGTGSGTSVSSGPLTSAMIANQVPLPNPYALLSQDTSGVTVTGMEKLFFGRSGSTYAAGNPNGEISFASPGTMADFLAQDSNSANVQNRILQRIKEIMPSFDPSKLNSLLSSLQIPMGATVFIYYDPTANFYQGDMVIKLKGDKSIPTWLQQEEGALPDGKTLAFASGYNLMTAGTKQINTPGDWTDRRAGTPQNSSTKSPWGAFTSSIEGYDIFQVTPATGAKDILLSIELQSCYGTPTATLANFTPAMVQCTSGGNCTLSVPQ